MKELHKYDTVVNFSDYARRYEKTVLSMRKPATIVSVLSHIRKAESILEFPVSESAAQEYVSKLAGEMSARSVRNYWGTVSRILSRAKKEGLIAAVPEPELPRGFKTKQISLTVVEMRAIITKSEEPYSTLFYLLAETGLRIGEALALKPGDIQGDLLSVKRSLFNGKEQNPKTENSVRTITASKNLQLRLQTRLARRNGNGDKYTIFSSNRGDSFSQRAIGNRLKRTSYAVGCHAFRRGNSSLLAKLGCPTYMIKKRLGHAGDVTDDYIHLEPGFDKEWAEKLCIILGHINI